VFNGTVTVSSDKAKSLSESIATVRDAPGLAWWVIALIIAGAVLLLLLIVAYVLYRRNRQKTTRLRAQLASQPGGSGYDDGKRRGGTHRA
jgi:flagellar biosynthesis/type III secretory pathway M-ring protein FliF/YscJ